MNLHLIEASQFLYAGPKDRYITRGGHKTDKGWAPYDLPIGGISFLLNAVKEWQSENDEIVFCIDYPPTVKREIFELYLSDFGQYKGNRPPASEAIKFQKHNVAEILQTLGFNAIGVPGYEADDVIASIVKYYKDDYEHIYIHTVDSDLYYLVDNTVEVLPLRNLDIWQKYFRQVKIPPLGKYIHMGNWENSVLKNRQCPYNILTIIKLLDGEPGDNIPAVRQSVADTIVQNINPAYYKECGNNEFVRNFVLNCAHGHAPTKAILYLIQPIILPFRDVELVETEFDEASYNYLAKISGNAYANIAKNVTVSRVDKVDNLIDKYIDEYFGGE